MKRWHQETALMFKRWKQEMGKHGYDWRCPPNDVNACHCVQGIGALRKKKPYDCGNPRCGICHWSKWLPQARAEKKRAAIRFELESDA